MYENYIAEAKKGNKKPIVLMGIESPQADSVVLTTKTDWESGIVDSTLDTVTSPGDVTLDGESTTWIDSSLTTLGSSARHTSGFYNNKIYIHSGLTNGYTTVFFTNKFQEYDIDLDTFTLRTAGGLAVYDAASVVLDGKYYVFGGSINTAPGSTNRCFVCDLTTFTWSEITAFTGGNISSHFAVTDGTYIYVGGGQTSGLNYGFYRYDPVGNSWTPLASLPIAIHTAGVAFNDGKIYAIGSHQTTLAVYSIAADSWGTLSSPSPYYGETHAASVGDKIFFFIKDHASSTAYILYDYYPQSHTFDAVPGSGSVPWATSMDTDGDGKVFLTFGVYYGTTTATKLIKSMRRGYTSTGTLITPVVDMGITPTSNTSLYIDDTIPADTSIAYTAEGSTTGAFAGEEVSLGSVSDGASLTPYRYYQVTAVISTTEQTRTPTLLSMSFYAGDSEYIYYSTDNDNPIRGAKPYIPHGSLSVSSSSITLLDKPKTGEVSIKLFWAKDTGDLIATGNLKNKAVIVKTGFDGLIEDDFIPFFTGTFYDYAADPINMRISIKVRDLFKQFKKLKYPFETSDASDNKTTVPITWTAANVIQVIQDILTALNVGDRYIDTDGFNTLKTGALSGTDWNVTRTLSKPEPVLSLLNELAVIAGIFLVPMPNGQLTPIVYNPSATVSATLDANNYKFSTLKGGQAKLYTRQLIYHTPTSGHPGSTEDDYTKVYIKVNATQELAWDEKSQRNWYEKWSASTVAIQALADRMDTWFSSPKIMTRINDVPARFIELNPGDIVAIDNLRIPIAKASWPGFSTAKKFLIMGKFMNPKKTTINFDLLEV